jgi:hypothetical protein
MARSTRSSRRGLFTRLYSPIGHLLAAGDESVGAVANTGRGVVGQGFKGLNKIGRSVTGHVNQAVSNVFSRKNRRGGNTRKNRKNRKASRKNRNNRK